MHFTGIRRRGETARYTQRLDIPVSEQVYDQVVALAGRHDLTKTQYARRVLEVHALGAVAIGHGDDCDDERGMVFEARIGGQGGGDKCTHRLDLPVSEELADAMTALASLSGRTKADYARWVLDIHLQGALAYSRARLGGQ